MLKYQKISSPFKRDVDGTKKLIKDQYTSPVIEYLKNNKWIFTEKVDGTNISIHWDGYKILFHGRTENTNFPKYLYDYLNETFNTPENEQLFEQMFQNKEVYLFGEAYGGKIQNGTGYSDDVSFIGIDVVINGTYLNRENAEMIFKAFGILMVPIIINGTINDAVEFVIQHPNSTISKNKNCFMEGLVGVPDIPIYDNQGNRIIIKVKYNDVKDFN